MATKAAAVNEGGGGFDWGKWIERAIVAALIFGVIYLVATIGLGPTIATFDPGGTGTLMERVPRVVRNLGFTAMCLGFVIAVGEAMVRGPKHGRRLAVVGGVTFLAMVGAPGARDWLVANGADALATLLNMALALLKALAQGLRT